jgi:hypothetical protein
MAVACFGLRTEYEIELRSMGQPRAAVPTEEFRQIERYSIYSPDALSRLYVYNSLFLLATSQVRVSSCKLRMQFP